ncbi:ABC transporter ATP-binding protein [candidate division TA06 bacterium]|nr:ABC transporter ATP-binding protein [candidate division TA06 bacterium]
MEDSFLLEAHHLHKYYRTRVESLHVLKGLDLKIRTGEMIFIVGPSGSGKSTLLHILGSLDRPDEGEVILEDEILFEKSESELARLRNQEIGFIFQFHHLLPDFTALENVMMPQLIGRMKRKEVQKRAKDLLQEVGLLNRETHRPSELSGGEKQRVAVARALIHSPKIVLADEPTGNLDSASSTALYNLLLSLSRERNLTFLIVTHNEALAQKGDRILQLVDGIIQNNP